MYCENPIASYSGKRLPRVLKNRRREKKRSIIMRKEIWEHFRLTKGFPDDSLYS